MAGSPSSSGGYKKAHACVLLNLHQNRLPCCLNALPCIELSPSRSKRRRSKSWSTCLHGGAAPAGQYLITTAWPAKRRKMGAAKSVDAAKSLEPKWIRSFGHIQDLFRACLGHVWNMFWICFGHVQDMCWICLGHVLDKFRTCFCKVWGKEFDKFWRIFGP